MVKELRALSVFTVAKNRILIYQTALSAAMTLSKNNVPFNNKFRYLSDSYTRVI